MVLSSHLFRFYWWKFHFQSDYIKIQWKKGKMTKDENLIEILFFSVMCGCWSSRIHTPRKIHINSFANSSASCPLITIHVNFYLISICRQKRFSSHSDYSFIYLLVACLKAPKSEQCRRAKNNYDLFAFDGIQRVVTLIWFLLVELCFHFVFDFLSSPLNDDSVLGYFDSMLE